MLPPILKQTHVETDIKHPTHEEMNRKVLKTNWDVLVELLGIRLGKSKKVKQHGKRHESK